MSDLVRPEYIWILGKKKYSCNPKGFLSFRILLEGWIHLSLRSYFIHFTEFFFETFYSHPHLLPKIKGLRVQVHVV